MEEDKLNLNLNDDSSFREFHTTSNFKVKNSLSNQWHPLNIQAHRDIYPHGQTRFSNFKTNYWTWLFCLQPKTNSDYWKKSIIVGLDENNLDQEIKNLGLDTKWGKLKRSLLKTDVKILNVGHPVDRLYNAWKDSRCVKWAQKVTITHSRGFLSITSYLELSDLYLVSLE